MATIIALKGPGNIGKSSTIWALHNLMLNNGFTLIDTTHNSQNQRQDFISTFTKKGKTVGLTSSGDTHDLVLDRLTDLVNANSEVCVCACRSYDKNGKGTHAAVHSFTAYTAIFVDKTYTSNSNAHSQVNQTDAQNILNRINSLI